MVTLVGVILLALGLSLAVVWQASVVDVLMGVIPLSLIFWGGLALLIGYSEVKARREYRKAVSGDAESAASRKPRSNREAGAGPASPNGTAASAATPPASNPQPSPPNHSTP